MTNKQGTGAVRVSLDISPAAYELLASLAVAHGTTKSQILRRALALYHVASEANESGHKLGVIDSQKKLVSEIIGL